VNQSFCTNRGGNGIGGGGGGCSGVSSGVVPGECDAAEKNCNWCGCSDDESFVRAVVKDVQNRFCVDRSRMYLTGMSAGGQCQAAAAAAAVAAVAAAVAVVAVAVDAAAAAAAVVAVALASFALSPGRKLQ
jgi:poly(3-hydroxybutyrate) depolymerase